jgi:quinol monooxygenase YgiN
MRVVTRHRPSDPAGFQESAAQALAVLAEQPGFRSGELARSPDDAAQWLLTMRWADAGSMRRGMGSYAAKVALGPLMPSAADEASVFEVLLDAGPGSVSAAASDLAADPASAP